MEKAKKMMLVLALTLGFGTLGFSQLNGEKQQAISMARQAAGDCVSRPDLAGLQLTYVATETSICDFLPGTHGVAIFGYQVDVYAEGHCPGNVRELCDPFFAKVATVFVSCGNATVTDVICY